MKAVFFDVDETLVDSSKAHKQADILAFAEVGVDYNWVQEALKGIDLIGRKVAEGLKIAVEAIGMTEQIDLAKLIQRRAEIFIDLVKQETFLLAGAKEAVINAKDAGAIVALVSSGSGAYLNVLMDQFSLRKYVDFVICAEDVEYGKPAPDCYLLAYARLIEMHPEMTISKAETLVVEDSNNGINAAQGAGLKTLMVPYKYTGEIKVKPDYILKSLEGFDAITFND